MQVGDGLDCVVESLAAVAAEAEDLVLLPAGEGVLGLEPHRRLVRTEGLACSRRV